MKRLLFGLLGILPGLATGADGSNAEGAATASYEGQVVRLEVSGRALADLRKFKEWQSALERAEDEKAQAVVLEIEASEGYIDETMKLMGQVAGMATPVYALVKGQALGAGALLAVSANGIYMTSDAVISGAGALDSNGEAGGNDRTRSLLLAKLRTVVAKRGYDVNMVRAMVVPAESELRFGEVIVPKGTILTLTAAEATSSVDGRPLLARGVVENVDGLLAAENLSGAAVLAGKEPATRAEGATKPPAERQGVKREEEGADNLIRGKEESFEGKVVVLKVGETDLINDQSFRFWRRMLRRAEDEGARAVIFDLDTPGGLAFKTKEIMTEITRLKVPSFAFVNEDALSAGALVSVATDGIYMNPDGVIGAAGLVSSTGEIGDMMRKKLHSVFEAHVRGVAEKKGYDPELIRAMMIPDETKDRAFGDVVVKKGELLTLTASEATSLRDGQPLLAKGMVTSVEELAEAEGMVGAPIVRAEPTPFENFAWWVARFSPLLILVGIGAAYAEMKAPGFGVAGAISLTAFGVFFFGNYVAGNLAGYEMFALFLLGVVLIALEIFLIPGTGLTGIAGALCIVASLLFGMVDKIDFGDWKVGEFDGSIIGILSGPALNLGLGLIGAVILILLLMRYLPAIPILRGLTLQKELAGGASIEDADHAAPERVGWTGECLTDLRPAGKVQFRDEILDVVADGDFVPKGANVRITEEDGMRIVVRES